MSVLEQLREALERISGTHAVGMDKFHDGDSLRRIAQEALDGIRDEISNVPPDNKVKGGRICLVCHNFWPEAEVLCQGCLKALSNQP